MPKRQKTVSDRGRGVESAGLSYVRFRYPEIQRRIYESKSAGFIRGNVCGIKIGCIENYCIEN